MVLFSVKARTTYLYSLLTCTHLLNINDSNLLFYYSKNFIPCTPYLFYQLLPFQHMTYDPVILYLSVFYFFLHFF